MGNWEKVLNSILSGVQDANINFKDLIRLLEMFGFKLRIKGDHHILTRQEARRNHIK